MLIGFTFFYLVRSHSTLASPWNPHVVVIPLLALFILTSSALSGDSGCLPLTAVLASFIAQTHIGLAPVAVAFGILSFAAAIIAAPTSNAEQRARRHVLELTGWITALIWLLPLIEQATHRPGNMTVIARFFFSQDHPHQSIAHVLYAWSDMFLGVFRPDFKVPQGWVLDSSVHSWPTPLALIEIVGISSIMIVARRRQERFLSMLAMLTLLACLITLWSTTRIIGDIVDHEVFWISAIGVIGAALITTYVSELVMALVGNELFPVVAYHRVVGLAAVALFLGATTLAAIELTPMRQRWLWFNPKESIVRTLEKQVGPGLRRLAIQKPVTRIHLDGDLWGVAAGILLQMRKAGVPYSVSPEIVSVFGQALSARGDEDAELDFANPMLHTELAARPGNVLIAFDHSVFIDVVKKRPDDRVVRRLK